MNWLNRWAHKHGHLWNTYKPASIESWWFTDRGDLIMRRQYYCELCKETDPPAIHLIATAEHIAEAKARIKINTAPIKNQPQVDGE